MAFKKALIEGALGAEMGHHPGYPADGERPEPVDLRAMNGMANCFRNRCRSVKGHWARGHPDFGTPHGC